MRQRHAPKSFSATALLRLSRRAVIRSVFMMAMSVPIATALVSFMVLVPLAPPFTPSPVPFAPAPSSTILDPTTRRVVVTCAGLHPPTWAPGVVLTIPCPSSRYPDKAASRCRWRFIARSRRRHDDQTGYVDVDGNLCGCRRADAEEGQGACQGKCIEMEFHGLSVPC